MQLTPIIAIHMSAALAAIATGPVALWARKGSRQRPRLHRAFGYAWVTLMVVTAVTALFIRDTTLPNVAGYTPIHLLVPVTFLGLFGAFRKLALRDIAGHRKIMQALYFFACIVAGAFTLLPQRYLGRLLRGQLADVLPVLRGTPWWVWAMLAGLVLLAMTLRTIRPALLAALALVAASAQAGTGLMTLPGVAGDLPVTVFYPTAQADQPVRRGPFTLNVAPDAAPVRGNGRLVVISHGSGGNASVHADLARTLVAAGFVVALPEHRGDNPRDHSQVGAETWKQRPAEVSRAIDAVAAAPAFAPLLSLDRVGMYGMSAGGHTALTLAGGRWSPAQLRRHCEAHLGEDFSSCVGLAARLRGNVFDGLKKTVALPILRSKLQDEQWYAHRDPGVQAVVAGVPFAADFDPQSLARPAVPLGLVTAGRDEWLVPRFHSDVILQACRPRCELVAHVPTGGHGALLAPPPPPEILGGNAKELLADPPGFDRTQMPAVDQRIAAFFRQHLLP